MVAIVICAIIILGGYAVSVTVKTIKDGGYTIIQVIAPIITAIVASIAMVAAVVGKIQIASYGQAIGLSIALLIVGILYTIIERLTCIFGNRPVILSVFLNLFAIMLTWILSVN